MTAERKLDPRSTRLMQKALSDFGYAGVSVEMCQEIGDKLLAGEKVEGIFAMFIAGWLKDAGLL